MTTQAPHIITITATDGYLTGDHDDYDWTIECPGNTAGGCNTWRECGDAADEDEELQRLTDEGEEAIAHGIEHMDLGFGWSVETGECWLQVCDNTGYAIEDASPGQRPVPGRYVITSWDSDEDWIGDLVLVPDPSPATL